MKRAAPQQKTACVQSVARPHAKGRAYGEFVTWLGSLTRPAPIPLPLPAIPLPIPVKTLKESHHG